MYVGFVLRLCCECNGLYTLSQHTGCWNAPVFDLRLSPCTYAEQITALHAGKVMQQQWWKALFLSVPRLVPKGQRWHLAVLLFICLLSFCPSWFKTQWLWRVVYWTKDKYCPVDFFFILNTKFCLIIFY